MKIEIAVVADIEYREAYDWYEVQKKNLGKSFRQQIKTTLRRIKKHPYFNSEIEPGYFAAYVKVFPYKLIYKIDGDIIYILAYAHLSREPNYWHTRI